MSSIYSGGFSPGDTLFAVDGDFTSAFPTSPPMNITNPFTGDSFPDVASIVLLNSAGAYVEVPIGSGYNIQPFAANQSCIVFEQDFAVAQENYVPLRLNTPYNTAWSIGWEGTFIGLDQCFLVAEGPLMKEDGGFVRFVRKFASLPPTRNEFESYTYTFPPVNVEWTAGGSVQSKLRPAQIKIVQSRVQYDFFVYDDLNLLSALVNLFPSGHRLNATTGVNPIGLILPEMRYFQPAQGTAGGQPLSVNYGLVLEDGSALTDDLANSGAEPTIPSATEYRNYILNGSEIVVECSYGPGPWLGNIYCRKTRFVKAQ